jgi:hypothetical protein
MPMILGGPHEKWVTGTASFKVLASSPFTQFGGPGCRSL